MVDNSPFHTNFVLLPQKHKSFIMVTVISIMAAGIIIGLFFRNMNGFLKILDLIIMLAIFLLLFFLGVAVGVNDLIIQNLGSYGLSALLLTFGGVAGSVVLALLVYRSFFKRKG